MSVAPENPKTTCPSSGCGIWVTCLNWKRLRGTDAGAFQRHLEVSTLLDVARQDGFDDAVSQVGAWHWLVATATRDDDGHPDGGVLSVRAGSQ